MKTNKFASIVAIGILTIWASSVRAGDTFSFAGFTFNQLNTPPVATFLGTNAVLGGATFSAGIPTAFTAIINNFPGGTGFKSNLCLAPLTGLSTNSVRAVNLPDGNNSVTFKRHGIEVAWTNRALPNLSGADFVIFESGSSSSAPEGIMTRAHTLTNGWTDWYYFAPGNFQLTSSPEGLFTDAFDLSAMAVPNNDLVDRIQLANLMPTDRILTSNGEGKVVFDGSTTNLPNAGNFDSDGKYDSSTYDPDPLYVAALHDVCETVVPTLTFLRSTNSLTIKWPAPSCYTLQSATNIPSTNTFWVNAPEINFITNGQITVIANTTTNQRFFRLFKP